MLPSGTPQSADDYFGVVECAVQMARHLLDVQTSQADDSALRVGRAGVREEGEDAKGFFKFADEDILMDLVLNPPRLLATNMPLGSSP